MLPTSCTGWRSTVRSSASPNAVFVWLLVGLVLVFVLKRTPLGRYIYAIGNEEGAAYLSGVNTRAVIVACFAISGTCSALAGVLLAGYSTKGYQAMGDPYLLPAIAAVVLGGTHILGGRGSFLGTVAGVILISLLQSILSVMQMPEAGRQIIYGVVIISMLLVYGRGAKVMGVVGRGASHVPRVLRWGSSDGGQAWLFALNPNVSQWLGDLMQLNKPDPIR